MNRPSSGLRRERSWASVRRAYNVGEQIAILYCGVHGLLKDVPLDKVHDFEKALINNLQGTDVLETLQKGVIDDKITAKLDEVAALVAASLKTA